MKSMKKLLTGESMTSLMGSQELPFFEARNMKAGSRSPLPISPMSSQMTTGSMQESLNTMFNRSFTQMSQSTSQLDSPTSIIKPSLRPKPKIHTSKPSILRPAPSAPNLNLSLSSAKSRESIMSDYEPIGTMNNEPVKTPDKDDNDPTQSWNKIKQELENIKNPIDNKTAAPAVITEPTSTLDGTDYDRLNFFGSTSRLNNSSGYKPVPFHHATSAPSFNQYDEVSPIESVRSADDSHLGYAKIRRDPLNSSLKEVKDKKEVSHQYTNREPYAVISKAKHV